MKNCIYILCVLCLLSCNQDPLPENEAQVKNIQPVVIDADVLVEPKPVSLEDLEQEVLPRPLLVSGLKSILDSFIEEKLPFDEPRVEVGQEDGKLRELWQVSWRKGRGKFGYRGEWYYVRSNEGHAIPPQVCADVIVDAFDRLGGSWWVDNKRYDSESSFTNFIKSYEKYPRRVPDLIHVMKSNPEYFEILYSKERDGVRLKDFNQLQLLFNEFDLSLGDIVFINGPTPWDKKHEHWHSFFVYSLDMEKGDWEIVGNASMSAKRWLKSEANRTPYRRVWYVFRPTTLFLDKVTNKERLGSFEQMETIR